MVGIVIARRLFQPAACPDLRESNLTIATSEHLKPLSAYRHLSPERERAKNKLPHPTICSMRSAPSYPAWQIFAGKSTEIYALPIINPRSKTGSSGSGGTSKGKSLDAAAIKISVGFYKNCVAIFYTYEKQYYHIKNDASLSVMPLCWLFLTAGMLSLRSGLFLFYQEKRKSPSAAADLYRFFIGSRA